MYSVPKTTTTLSSPPTYKNPELEQIINENKNEDSLGLGGKDLTGEDIEIVCYYLLRNNKVRNCVFVSTFTEHKLSWNNPEKI